MISKHNYNLRRRGARAQLEVSRRALKDVLRFAVEFDDVPGEADNIRSAIARVDDAFAAMGKDVAE